MIMRWCDVCDHHHMYGPCTATVKSEEQAWAEWREKINKLSVMINKEKQDQLNPIFLRADWT